LPYDPKSVVFARTTEEWVEAMKEGKRDMLENAKRLEEADEDLCDTEEAKVAFRAFKAKIVHFYRKAANTKPEESKHPATHSKHH